MVNFKELASELIQIYTKIELDKINQDHNKIKAQLPQLMKNSFVNRLISLGELTKSYSSLSSRERALEYIDFEKIYGGVDERESKQEELIKKGELPISKQYGYQDFIVLELLAWFKNDFFKWVNKPECTNCGTDSHVQNIGASQPTDEERNIGQAGIVEMYKCSACSSILRFPRFNNPVKLLETRSGRCGEWCNCFMLILSSMEIPCRYIWNFEDHVWCEVYSVKQKRWIHLDCCENSFDEPLLYAKGWGKKMSYVFGITDNNFTDVSKRYIDKDHQLPRNQIDEATLKLVVRYVNTSKMLRYFERVNGDMDEFYHLLVQNSLESRDLDGLVVKTASKTEDLKPRESGKGEWTENRGENGN